MSGWRADGRTRRDWRQCVHPYVKDERCTDCRARDMGEYRQVAYQARGGVTGADMEPVMTVSSSDISHLRGSADSRDRFMHGPAHIEKAS